VVLDIDHEKNVIDCSERLYAAEESKQVSKKHKKEEGTPW